MRDLTGRIDRRFGRTETVAEEPVYSPDQLKPGHRKWGRRGALGSAVIIVLMALWDNHEGNTETVYLVLIALLLVGAVVLDSILRRNGLKPNDQ
jgi:hypothetical protein